MHRADSTGILRRRSRRAEAIAVASTMAIGCSAGSASAPAQSPVKTAPASERDEAAVDPVDSAENVELSEPAPPEPVVLITDREDLAAFRQTHEFGALLFDLAGRSTKQLRESPAYRSLMGQVRDASGGFPMWWLGHPDTHWSLAGIANRMDRMDLRPGTCGEVRLLYRLEHRKGDAVRTLPAALNVVFRQDESDGGCREVAARWIQEANATISALGEPNGPLHTDVLDGSHLLAIEANLRVDDGTRGTSRNALSVHEYDPGRRKFHGAALEFEPNGAMWKGRGWRGVSRDLTTDELRSAVARGTPNFLVSHKYYGRDYVPWTISTTEGQGPLRPTFLEESIRKADVEVPTAPFSDLPALAFRMDTLTCSGCHARRSVGGFHLPGEGTNQRVAGGRSAHLDSEVPWRRAYVLALASGKEPNRVRKIVTQGPAGVGRHCSLPSSPIPDLSCDAGSTCRTVSNFAFGQCFPDDYDGPGPCTDASESCDGPTPWTPGGYEHRACETEGPTCAFVIGADDYAKCRFEHDPWKCARARAALRRVDPCAGPNDCRDGFTCTGRPEHGAVCQPTASLSAFRSSGHAPVLR